MVMLVLGCERGKVNGTALVIQSERVTKGIMQALVVDRILSLPQFLIGDLRKWFSGSRCLLLLSVGFLVAFGGIPAVGFTMLGIRSTSTFGCGNRFWSIVRYHILLIIFMIDFLLGLSSLLLLGLFLQRLSLCRLNILLALILICSWFCLLLGTGTTRLGYIVALAQRAIDLDLLMLIQMRPNGLYTKWSWSV